MPKYCRAPHCSNAAGQPRPPARRLSFYKFPLQDGARLRQWLAQMRQEDWVPTRHQHLCSDHFEPSCFQYRWGVRYLRPDAVPTIFPPGPPKRENPSTVPGAARPEQPFPVSGTKPVTPGGPPGPETVAAAALPLGPVDQLEPGDGPAGGVGCAAAAPPSSPRTPAEDAAVEAPAAILPPAPAYFEPVPAAPETILSSALALPIVSTVPIVSKALPAAPGELSTEELVGVALVLQRKVKVLQQRHRRHRARLEAMEGLVEQLRRESLVSEERLKLACLQPGPATPDAPGAITIICQEEAAALL